MLELTTLPRFRVVCQHQHKSCCCYWRLGTLTRPDSTPERGRCGGDSHPGEASLPGSVGLARAHPLTKTEAMRPPRRTRYCYGAHYPLGRWLHVLYLRAFFTPSDIFLRVIGALLATRLSFAVFVLLRRPAVLCATFYPLTLLEPQSRFGDNTLKFQVVCPQNGTAVLKGLTTSYRFLGTKY